MPTAGCRSASPRRSAAGPAAGGCRLDPARDGARVPIRDALGREALVDTAAAVADFERMVGIEDAAGVPPEAPVRGASADLRRERGIEAYGSAACRPWAGPLKRAVAGAIRGAVELGVRLPGQGHASAWAGIGWPPGGKP